MSCWLTIIGDYTVKYTEDYHDHLRLTSSYLSKIMVSLTAVEVISQVVRK